MIIGLSSGDGNSFPLESELQYLCRELYVSNLLVLCVVVVYSVSLRQQLQDVGKKLVGAQHYNKDGSVNNRQG